MAVKPETRSALKDHMISLRSSIQKAQEQVDNFKQQIDNLQVNWQEAKDRLAVLKAQRQAILDDVGGEP